MLKGCNLNAFQKSRRTMCLQEQNPLVARGYAGTINQYYRERNGLKGVSHYLMVVMMTTMFNSAEFLGSWTPM
jgi:hypothetical protein